MFGKEKTDVEKARKNNTGDLSVHRYSDPNDCARCKHLRPIQW